MRLKNQLINFFTTKFSENTKYSNSLNAALRLFFERLTNVNNTFTSLGNVYKNSKWTDLKVDTIKVSFNFQFLKNCVKFIMLVTLSFFTIIFVLYLADIEVPQTNTYLYSIYDAGSAYLLASFYFIGCFYQRIVCFFLNKSMKVFANEWLEEEKKKEAGRPPVSTSTSVPQNLAKKKSKRTLKNQKKELVYYPFILDADSLEMVWYIEKCKEKLEKVDMHIDFNSYNKSHLLVRNLDVLDEMLGGNMSMETIMRVVYFDLEQSNKRKPRQDFSFAHKEMRYARMPSLAKFTKNNPYISSKQSSYSLVSSFHSVQNLDLVAKKVLMDNISRNTLIAKQTKWSFKNNILSDSFILKSLGITNAKKLVGSSTSNDALKFNIWLSNKMYNNKHFLKMSKSLVESPQTNEFFLQNLNLFKTQSLLDFIENSIFWSAKRFKFLQSFNTNVQYTERKRASFPVKEAQILTIDFNSLFFLFNSVLNSRCNSNSFVNYYNFGAGNNNLKANAPLTILTRSRKLRNIINLNLQNNLFFSNYSEINLPPLSQLSANYQHSTREESLIEASFSTFLRTDPSIFTKALFHKQEKNISNYIVSLADQLIFTPGYNSLFLSYIGNSILIDKQSLKVFNNIRRL